MSSQLRSLRLTIIATVQERHTGSAGPAALLRWADRFGHAVVMATAPWRHGAAADLLANAEAGNRLSLTGVVHQTAPHTSLPTEFVLMDVETIVPLQAQGRARQQLEGRP